MSQKTKQQKQASQLRKLDKLTQKTASQNPSFGYMDSPKHQMAKKAEITTSPASTQTISLEPHSRYFVIDLKKSLFFISLILIIEVFLYYVSMHGVFNVIRL